MLQLAHLNDRAAINELACQVHAMHVSWRPDIYEMVAEPYPEERLLQAVKERSLYVAKIDGIVVGYTALKIREYAWPGVVRRKVMLVDEFAVHESCRGQGIGTEMMQEVRVLANAFGCTDLQLSVYPQNDDAVGFYQKCGFMIQSITMQRKV